MAKVISKLSMKAIDEKVLRVLQIKEQQKQLAEELKILQTELEAQFNFPAVQREEIFGKETYITKSPTDIGKNNYDVNLLKEILKPLRKLSTVVKKVEVIDMTELNKLIKEGKITEEQLLTCRQSKWTYKTFFKRIENKNNKAS